MLSIGTHRGRTHAGVDDPAHDHLAPGGPDQWLRIRMPAAMTTAPRIRVSLGPRLPVSLPPKETLAGASPPSPDQENDAGLGRCAYLILNCSEAHGSMTIAGLREALGPDV